MLSLKNTLSSSKSKRFHANLHNEEYLLKIPLEELTTPSNFTYYNLLHTAKYFRFGKLLAEGSPQELLERYEKPNLEDVFLDLCMQDGDMETAQVREERSTRPNIIKGIHSVEILRFLYSV